MSLIIFLHGASSSGKSTLARAISAQSKTPFMHLSFDTLRDGGAIRGIGAADWPVVRPAVFDGLHRSIAGFAEAGLDLIVEHILDTAGWHGNLKALLAPHRVIFVGLYTPDATLADREAARGDRKIGSALADARRIHGGLRYDMTLNGEAPPEANAAQILGMAAAPPEKSGFFD